MSQVSYAEAGWGVGAHRMPKGFTALWSHQRLDLTVEAHVLRDEFAVLFIDADRQRARDRLELYGWQDNGHL
jgi:hypothetical protein